MRPESVLRYIQTVRVVVDGALTSTQSFAYGFGSERVIVLSQEVNVFF